MRGRNYIDNPTLAINLQDDAPIDGKYSTVRLTELERRINELALHPSPEGNDGARRQGLQMVREEIAKQNPDAEFAVFSFPSEDYLYQEETYILTRRPGEELYRVLGWYTREGFGLAPDQGKLIQIWHPQRMQAKILGDDPAGRVQLKFVEALRREII